MQQPFFLSYIVSWLAITTGIWTLFIYYGKSADQKTKRSASKWLKNLDISEGALNWSDSFAKLFDRIFTDKHFTWSCFLRSSVASIASVVLMALIYILLNYELLANQRWDVFIPYGFLVTSRAVFVCLFAFNLIPDYLSLLETRYIIKRMGLEQSFIRNLAFLVLDFAATFLIFVVVGVILITLVMLPITFFSSVLEFDFSGIGEAMKSFPKFMIDSFHIKGDSEGFSVFLYSTFFTSVWVWLYAISGFLIKTLSHFNRGLRFFKRHFNIEKEPFNAIGAVAMTLVTILFLLYPIYRLLRLLIS